MKKNISALIFGLLLFLCGGVYLGTVVFGWEINIFFNGWWTLFIIVPSFASLLINRPNWFNLSALLIGVILLLAAQDIIRYSDVWICILAAVVMSIGVSLIIGAFKKPKPYPNFYTQEQYTSCGTGESTPPPPPPSPSGKNYYGDDRQDPSYNAILSGLNAKNNSTDFSGAHISAILGGADIDLRDVIINRDITVYCTAILGGVDVFAPRNVRINLVKTDILGESECKAYCAPPEAQVPVVTFNCTTVMGGITIK